MSTLLRPAPTSPICTINGDLLSELAAARYAAASLSTATTVASFPDHHFGDDHPIRVTVSPMRRPRRESLVVTTTYWSAMPDPARDVIVDVAVTERIWVSVNGGVDGSSSCDTMVGQAEMAIEALLRPE